MKILLPLTCLAAALLLAGSGRAQAPLPLGTAPEPVALEAGGACADCGCAAPGRALVHHRVERLHERVGQVHEFAHHVRERVGAREPLRRLVGALFHRRGCR